MTKIHTDFKIEQWRKFLRCRSPKGASICTFVSHLISFQPLDRIDEMRSDSTKSSVLRVNHKSKHWQVVCDLNKHQKQQRKSHLLFVTEQPTPSNGQPNSDLKSTSPNLFYRMITIFQPLFSTLITTLRLRLIHIWIIRIQSLIQRAEDLSICFWILSNMLLRLTRRLKLRLRRMRLLRMRLRGRWWFFVVDGLITSWHLR